MNNKKEDYAIICQNIKKTFISDTIATKVLININLKIKNNEFVMIVGPSGSGKTTLISIIAGILNATSGDVFVLNNNIKDLEPKAKTNFIGKNIGFIFQSINLIPYINAIENVSIPLLIQNVKESKAKEMSKDFLIKLGLGSLINRYPKELSKGEQQRVAIARGCIHNPKIVICDEPASYLDTANRIIVLNLLKTIQKELKSTIIVVTHDTRLFKFGERIFHLEDGIIKNTTKNNPFNDPIKNI